MSDGNAFVSSNWISRDTELGDLGEQPGGKPWLNGADLKGYPGTEEDCIDASWFVDGLPTGETTGPWDADSKLECCTGPPPTPCDLRTTDPDHPQLLMTVSSPDCACVDGLTSILTWNAVSLYWDNLTDPNFCGGANGNFEAIANLFLDPDHWLLGFSQHLTVPNLDFEAIKIVTCTDGDLFAVVTIGGGSAVCPGSTVTLTVTIL